MQLDLILLCVALIPPLRDSHNALKLKTRERLIQFTPPDKSLGVANLDLAVIELIAPDGRVTARLDTNRQIEFNASAHWMKPGENPPVGLNSLRRKGGRAEAHYALDNLPNKVLAAEYKTVLRDEKSHRRGT
jgi:hypothetical protein